PQPTFRAPLMRFGLDSMTAQEMDMSLLAGALSDFVKRTVIDKTGLTKKYDVKLTWTPDQMPAAAGAAGGDAPAVNENGPSLFTAIQEQLGLRLESTRGPVELIVIDHVEKATEN